MKELNQIILGKGAIGSIKWHFFDKKTLGQSRRTGGGWIPPNWDMFFTCLIQIEKNIFFQKGTFYEASDPWMLYLSKIGPDKWASDNSIINAVKRVRMSKDGLNVNDMQQDKFQQAANLLKQYFQSISCH